MQLFTQNSQKEKDPGRINYSCIMLEGLFNTLGTDILGISTIVPLFLSQFGASLTLIGSLSSMQQIISAVTPLVTGGLIAAAASKKRLSILFNGISRGSILLLPVLLLFHVPDHMIVKIFFALMLVYFLCQSMSGIIWNHLLGDCVEGGQRGKLVGTLFSISGLITFFSSNLVKVIRDSQRLDRWSKYALIFGLAGILLAVSVMCFLPLQENKSAVSKAEKLSPKAYLKELLLCFQNRDYTRLLLTSCFSQASLLVNAFIYLFAQDFLKLSTPQVSTLLVLQTMGVIVGGFVTGRISSRFGTKRMLLLVESIGLMVPVMNLMAMRTAAPFVLMGAAVFLMGFSKSGYLGYQTHLLEIVDPEKKIYHLVCKSMVMLPLSLISTLVGWLLQQFSGKGAVSASPIYIGQIVLALFALLSASRLKLITYKTSAKK